MAITKILEKGSMIIPILTKTEGCAVISDTREFYYDYVVWVDDVKFIVGCFDEEKKYPEAMLEVSTGAMAVAPTEISKRANIDEILDKYTEKCLRYGKTSSQVVASFNKYFNVIQLWQIKLWVS